LLRFRQPSIRCSALHTRANSASGASAAALER
jgi:hypothetical protein